MADEALTYALAGSFDDDPIARFGESADAQLEAFDVWREYQPLLRASADNGAFGTGPSGDVPEEAPLARRLLDLTGRNP